LVLSSAFRRCAKTPAARLCECWTGASPVQQPTRKEPSTAFGFFGSGTSRVSSRRLPRNSAPAARVSAGHATHSRYRNRVIHRILDIGGAAISPQSRGHRMRFVQKRNVHFHFRRTTLSLRKGTVQ
jgi:hypothetical protein